MQRILLPIACALAGAVVATAVTALLQDPAPPASSPAVEPAPTLPRPEPAPPTAEPPDRATALESTRASLAGPQPMMGIYSAAEHKLTELNPELVAMLGDGRQGRQAAWALGELGDARAIEPLRAAFASGELPLRRAAAEALAKLGDASAMAEFIDAAYRQMTTDPDGELRRTAVRELAALRDPATLEMLGQALADTNSAVRREAARALGRMGGAAERGKLEPLLADPVQAVRDQAGRSIGMIDDPEKSRSGFSVGEMVIEAFIGDGGESILIEGLSEP